MGGYIMQAPELLCQRRRGNPDQRILGRMPSSLSMVFESGGTDDQEPYDQIYGDRGDY